MHTRRSFIANAALSFAVLPHVGHAVTEMPVSARWPGIQGPGVDPERTRFISGRGIRKKPSNSQMNRPDLGFVRNTDDDPSMVMTHGVVLARAMAPDFPLIAMDAASGRLAWERERTLKILGVSDEIVFIVTASDSDENMAIIKAVNVTGPTDLWAAGEYEIAGSVVVPKKALVYARQHEDRVELVARDMASGNIKWTVDVTDDIGSMPGTLSTDGNIVVDVYQTANISTVMTAWDAENGELLWRHESFGFISSATFHDEELVVATMEGVQLLDPTSGEVVRRLELPHDSSVLVKLIVTNDALIVVDSQHMHSIDWNSGAVNWSRAPMQAASTQEVYACDGMILRMENVTETASNVTSIRGYHLEDGRLVLDYRPIDADQNEVEAAAFMVGNGNLYLATNQGLGAWFATEKPLDPVSDPGQDGEYESEELGFSYRWTDDWEVQGTTFMTPHGQAFYNMVNHAAAAQYAGEARDSDSDLASSWHVTYGPDSRSINGVQMIEAPLLDFVPAEANVVAGFYHTTYNAPYDQMIGVRVIIPLDNEHRLVFEFLQAESLFDQDLPSFAVFFENLALSDSKPNVRRPDSD